MVLVENSDEKASGDNIINAVLYQQTKFMNHKYQLYKQNIIVKKLWLR